MSKHNAIVCDKITFTEKYDPAVSISRLSADDGIEVALVVSGNGVHQVINQAIPCKSGDVYVVPAHIPHEFFCAEDANELVVKRVVFDSKEFLSERYSTPGDNSFCYGIFRDSPVVAYAMLNSSTNKTVVALYNEITAETETKDGEWKEAVKALISLLLITLGRYIGSAIINAPALPPKEWHVVSQTVKAVTERFSECNLTLEVISQALFISKSHLSRLFGKTFGETFSDYLRRVRIAHACSLLQNTAFTVDEIAVKCGLRDIPSFYRNFQLATSMTPIQYRKSFKAEKKSDEKGEWNGFSELTECIRAGVLSRTKELISEALDNKIKANDILDAMLLGMSYIGEKFKNNEVYVPEVLVAARAMNAGIKLLKPILAMEEPKKIGRACLGTVRGDLHDIGKNLVKIMLEGKGIDVIDLGTDVDPETFVQTAIDYDCKIICCSALLTTTIGAIGEVVEIAKEKGIRDNVKILIGGAPVSEEFCKTIGADVYTPDAASAADEAEKILLSMKR